MPGKPADIEATSPPEFTLRTRACFLIFGSLSAAFGWSIARLGWIGFTTGEVAMVSLDRNSAFRVYSYASALLLFGAGPLCFGAAMIFRAFIPSRLVNAVIPIVSASFIAWLIAIPLAVIVLACNLIAPLFANGD